MMIDEHEDLGEAVGHGCYGRYGAANAPCSSRYVMSAIVENYHDGQKTEAALCVALRLTYAQLHSIMGGSGCLCTCVKI